MLSDAQIAESLDEILQDKDSDDDFIDHINFYDAVYGIHFLKLELLNQ